MQIAQSYKHNYIANAQAYTFAIRTSQQLNPKLQKSMLFANAKSNINERKKIINGNKKIRIIQLTLEKL